MNEQLRRKLLCIARRTVAEELGGPTTPGMGDAVTLAPAGGAFVTLRNGERLRGCMGTFAPTNDVADCIAQVARSACHDPRFASHPVSSAELNRIRIEISVLSAPERLVDLKQFCVGEHGVLIRAGERTGCFLPQVAVEHGWDVEQFIEQCCTLKAGLPSDAWKKPETTVMFFAAEVFGE